MAYTNLLNQVRVGVRPGIVLPTFTPLLDLYGGAAAAYSLRKLKTGATASIRVRRSSDNQETDIGFSADGTLDTTSLLSFTGNLNAISYSQDFDNAVWTKYGSTVTANTDIAPDGTMTADKMTEDTSNNWHGFYRYINQTVNSGVSWNSSFYAKKSSDNTMSSGQNVLMLRQTISGQFAESVGYFDLDTGIATFDVGSSNSAMNALGATMSNEGNGWWRCSLWGTNTTSAAKTPPTTIVRKSGSNMIFTGNTGAKFLLWGFRYYSTNNTSGLTLEPYTSTGNGYGGDAFVTKWYDQSGNARNAEQTSAISQPNIVKQKAVTMNGGKPSIKINNSVYDGMYPQGLRYNYGSMNLSATFSLFTVSKFDTTGNVTAVGGDLYSAYSPLWLNGIINSKFAHYSGGYVYGDSPNTNTNLHYLLNSSGSVTMGRNGGNNYYGSNTAMSGTNALKGISIGAGSFTPHVTNKMTGDVQEVILYNSDKNISRYSIDTAINSYYSIYTSTVDTDAQAFITAAGITDTTQQTAINKLVSNLKNIELWVKIKAIYPFVGGNATSHKFNLKDPRDVDAAYRLVFSGGWTHSSTGALPNGTTAYADTKLYPSILGYDIPWGDKIGAYIGIYLRTNTNTDFDQIDMGSIEGGHIFLSAWSKGTAFNPYKNMAISRYSSSGIWSSSTYSDNRGWYSLNRIGSTGWVSFDRNNVILQNMFTGQNILPSTKSLYLGALNNNGPIWHSNREISMSIMGSSLTDNDKTNLYTIVEQFQTDLGRQV